MERLVQAAATAPDHGRLRPWRLVAVGGEERARLGDALAEAADTPEQARRAAAKPLRAPLLLTIVHRPVPDHPKVPEWEQLAATTGMVTTLALLLHSHGFASIWRTGPAVQAPRSASTSASTTTSSSSAGCTSAPGSPPMSQTGVRPTPPPGSPGTPPASEPTTQHVAGGGGGAGGGGPWPGRVRSRGRGGRGPDDAVRAVVAAAA
ncbi:nitroreductase family protein, partial [Streptomyces zhihengii]|uniref:nitroreductase family protein n=1 Tax=Streptomyces zhihengii TaxID=1818004 RepID=UPI0033A30685